MVCYQQKVHQDGEILLPRMYKEKKKKKTLLHRLLLSAFDIKGEHLKGRGKFKEVDSSEVANYLELGWEDRGVSSKGKTIVWKDYTKEETRKKWAKLEMLCCVLQQVSYQLSAILLWLSCLKKIAANEEQQALNQWQDGCLKNLYSTNRRINAL